MKWFKRKVEQPVNVDAVPRAPYETQDSSESIYRIEKIIEIAGIWDQTLAYTAERLDKWVIREVSQGEGAIRQFIPHPLWDDEWLLTRSSFPTREQAEAFINRVGGELEG